MGSEDIVIVGAGPVGMAFALALQQAGIGSRLLDAREAGAAAADQRVLALSHGSCQLLERLGVWGNLRATPIRGIHVSQQGGFGRTRLAPEDYGVPALGYVAGAGDLARALEAALAGTGVRSAYGIEVQDLAPGAAEVALQVNPPLPLSARLVVLAEGRIGGGEGETGIVTRDYGQHAVICTATPAAPHGGIAWERFTTRGPVALLPHGKDYAVVFTASPADAQRLVALPDDAFLAELQAVFGLRVSLQQAGPRLCYPLGLRYRPTPVGPRTVWLGNAAQTLHPVAGQGFNLALRDVWDLAALLREHAGADPGDAALLARYAAARRFDRYGVIGFTDTLVRLFSNDHPLLRVARGGGLLALDLLPPLRHFIAKRMMFGARAWP